MEILLHPRVKKFLDESAEKERLISHFKNLAMEQYESGSSVDIKKLKGKKHTMYRFRVGEYRFEYFVDDGKIWVDNAFRRGRGYQTIDADSRHRFLQRIDHQQRDRGYSSFP